MTPAIPNQTADQTGGLIDPEDWRHGGFGLYVHWPFCMARCPYCDFNTHVVASIDQDRWAQAYMAEIARLGALLPGRILNSIFFGGGTPSLMQPEVVANVIDAARAVWPFANDIEITLEANPTSVEAGRFAGYAQAGVNRLSMGVQALNDEDLRRLGRLHSAAEAMAAFDIARAAFPRVSFDMIYARQHQGPDAWADELREALAMAVDHLSLYQLSIEAGTAFGARHVKGGLQGLPDDDLSADLWEVTRDVCEAAGMPAYEVSNHAKPGAESLHNLIYWRQGDWAAIGPGAHGRLSLGHGRNETVAHRQPGAWLDAVEQQGNGDAAQTPQSNHDRAVEYMLMGLRLHEGIDTTRLKAMDPSVLDPAGLDHAVSLGLVQPDNGRIALTQKGMPLLNAVLRQIIR